MDLIAFSLAKSYTDNSIAGTEGVIAGKNCTIKSIVKNGDTNTITFEWTADDGTTRTETMSIKDGATGPRGPKGDKGDPGSGGGGGGASLEVITKAEWEALTEEEAADRQFIIIDDEYNGDAYDIPYGRISVGDGIDGVKDTKITVGEQQIYSTEEHIVGYWIDGKPLYERTWKTTSPSSAGGHVSIIPATELINVESVPYIDGMIVANDGYQYIIGTSIPVACYFSFKDGAILMFISDGLVASCPISVTARYTKTTDSASDDIPMLVDGSGVKF